MKQLGKQQVLNTIIAADPYELGGAGNVSTLVALARKLQPRPVVFLPGASPSAHVEDIAKSGAEAVYRFNHPLAKTHPQEMALAGLFHLQRAIEADVILFSASEWGTELAARAAARFGVELLPDLIDLRVDDEGKKLLGASLGFQGSLICWKSLSCPGPWIATINQQAAEAGPEGGHAVKIEELSLEPGDEPCKVELVRALPLPADEMPCLDRAEVVVAGGAGVEGEAGFAMLKELALLLGGALGCTLPPVEQGYMDRELMVGATGKRVQAKCYIACGISGDAYHTSGMDSSENIVVINNDEKAPFYKIADYGIVGDLHEIVSCINAKLKESKQIKQ